MIQKQFADKAVEILKNDKNVIGLAVAGSWLTNEIDEFSDLDLILITKEKISGDKAKMLEYANRLGKLLNGFTGEHVGEPRVLICLYDDPLLHVDIKFLTLEEFHQRIEAPVILLDTNDQLKTVLEQTSHKFPYPDHQWIEDRFWIWVHYALLKIGRGEYVEAFDFFGALRMIVLGPLLQIKNKNLPRGVRKVETQLSKEDLEQLMGTLPSYSRSSLLESLQNAVSLYRDLRNELFDSSVIHQSATEKKVMEYFKEINPQPGTFAYAPVNGIKMYYEVHGTGTPLVLIHGGGSTINTTFGRILPLLSQHYKVIAMELQAHGRTSDRNAPESFEQDADDVAALLHHLNISKAHIMGFSNGGNTAMQIAVRHAALVNKLVIISAFYKREGMISGFFDGMQLATIDNMPAPLKDGYLQVNNDPQGLQTMFNKDRERMLNFKDWSDETLTSIQAPALLISADHDVAKPEHAVKMSQLIPNAELMILPGTHGSCIGEICSNQSSEIPEATVAVIREFLDK